MKERLLSLDVFRGATIASMILVNNAGDWEHTYPPLLHAEWHGWTFTDLVFPFFLWIAGVAMTLSFSKRMERGNDRGDNRGRMLLHTLRRAALIFLLGLLLNGFPYYRLSTLRIPGVLQRIAVCYLIGGAVYLYSSVRGRIFTATALLLLYAILMQPGGYELGSNFSNRVDAALMAGHMYGQTKTWDPEGIVSTLPAIATLLFGVLTGDLLRSQRPAADKIAWLLVAGNALIAAGLMLAPFMPINKKIWTGSYALFTGGMAAVCFGALYWLIDVQGWRRGTRPFAIYGTNAIVIYALSGVIARALSLSGLKGSIYRGVFQPLAGPYNASLLWAIANVLLLFLVAWILDRRGWFIRL